jgi:hypothetical protein
MASLQLQVELGGATLSWSTSDCVDIGLHVLPHSTLRAGVTDPSAAVSAFGIPTAASEPLAIGGWVGSVAAGSSVNCSVLTACFHGVGTHTECCGHALARPIRLHADVSVAPTLIPAAVLTLDPELYAKCADSERTYIAAKPDDLVLSMATAEAAFAEMAAKCPFLSADSLSAALRNGAVILRTLPNDDSKRSCDYTGKNPPYVLPSLMRWAAERVGVRHLLLDLPSADREDDGGHLLAHRAFWGLPPRGEDADAAVSERTITELCYVPAAVADGLYLLDLQVAPLHMDAAPSRPLLYPLRPRAP